MPHFDARLGPGHADEGFGAVEAHGIVPAFPEGEKISTRSTAQIEDALGPVGSDRLQQRVDVLGDIVIAGPLKKGLRALLILLQGAAADFRKPRIVARERGGVAGVGGVSGGTHAPHHRSGMGGVKAGEGAQ